MVLDPKKCHYMCLEKNCNNDKFVFDNLFLENSTELVILGIAIDKKLLFDSHVKSLCRKAGQKLCALSRVPNYLQTKQKKLIFNEMTKSQFSYCSLIWKFFSRKSTI